MLARSAEALEAVLGADRLATLRAVEAFEFQRALDPVRPVARHDREVLGRPVGIRESLAALGASRAQVERRSGPGAVSGRNVESGPPLPPPLAARAPW